MKRRVCFVINQLGGVGRGGSDRVVCLLANALADRGWSVDICVLTDDRTVDRDLRPSVKVYYERRILWSGRRARVVPRIVEGIRLVARYRRSHPDAVVVAFIAWVNICATLAHNGRRASGRLVLAERTNPGTDPSSRLARAIRDACYRRADALVFQTPEAMKYFGVKDSDRCRLIPNPVTPGLPAWRPDGSRCFVVAAGRLEAQKNMALLVRSFDLLRQTRPDAELTIFGEGKQRGELESLVESLGLGDRVHLPGHTPNVHASLCTASFFVLCSDYEGLPNSLLEAMSMGMPVIATDCPVGGPRMLIRDGVNGELVEVGNSHQLAAAMERLAGDGARAARLGERASESLSDYSVEKVVAAWEELLLGQSTSAQAHA